MDVVAMLTGADDSNQSVADDSFRPQFHVERLRRDTLGGGVLDKTVCGRSGVGSTFDVAAVCIIVSILEPANYRCVAGWIIDRRGRNRLDDLQRLLVAFY